MDSDMIKQMEELNKKFMKAFADGDSEAIGPMYTEDCKVLPTGQDVIEGRKGCVEYFGSLMKAGAVKCVATVDEFGPMDGDTSYDRSHFKLFKKDGSVMVDGK